MRLPFSRGLGVGRDAKRATTGDTDADRARSAETDAESEPRPGLGVRLAEGARGGFVATLAMTAYRLPISRSLPPTAEFWTKFVSGGDPDDHPVPAAALHLLYGTVGGVVFGLLAPIAAREKGDDGGGRSAVEDTSRGSAGDTGRDSADGDRNRDESDRETARLEAVGLLTGVGYALALSVFGERVMLERLLDLDLTTDERLVFHAGHVVYGLSLGTWFGSRTGDRR